MNTEDALSNWNAANYTRPFLFLPHLGRSSEECDKRFPNGNVFPGKNFLFSLSRERESREGRERRAPESERASERAREREEREREWMLLLSPLFLSSSSSSCLVVYSSVILFLSIAHALCKRHPPTGSSTWQRQWHQTIWNSKKCPYSWQDLTACRRKQHSVSTYQQEEQTGHTEVRQQHISNFLSEIFLFPI